MFAIQWPFFDPLKVCPNSQDKLKQFQNRYSNILPLNFLLSY